MRDETEFGVVARGDSGDAEMGIVFERRKRLADVGGEKIFVGSVEALFTGKAIESTGAESWAEEVKRGEFVTTPGRKPIGPTEVK